MHVRAFTGSKFQGQTSRNTLSAVILVVVAVSSFAGGFYAYKFFFAGSTGPERSYSLSISGYAIIRAYHADGTLYRVFENHNSLDPMAKNAIVACITGNNTTPAGINRCSSWIDHMELDNYTGNYVITSPSTNTLLPSGCNPTTPLNACSGWVTSASFAITKNMEIFLARATTAGFSFDFVYVSPLLIASPGDTVTATITFTVS